MKSKHIFFLSHTYRALILTGISSLQGRTAGRDEAVDRGRRRSGPGRRRPAANRRHLHGGRGGRGGGSGRRELRDRYCKIRISGFFAESETMSFLLHRSTLICCSSVNSLNGYVWSGVLNPEPSFWRRIKVLNWGFGFVSMCCRFGSQDSCNWFWFWIYILVPRI